MTYARRSRRGWPDQKEPETRPVVTVPETAVRSLRRAVMGLIAFVLLLAVAVALLLYYVFGRTQYRDAQQRIAQEEFKAGMCRVMDALPRDSVILDPLRAQYGCAPDNGIPLDQLPPQVRKQLQGSAFAPLTAGPLRDPDTGYSPQPDPSIPTPVRIKGVP